MASTHLGAPFRKGLPPGVYEARPAVVASVEVRSDVAAFVGLAERGPVGVATAIESFDEYLIRFGAAGGGRLLGQCVYLFFANGGRRCVVVRAVGPSAAPAEWAVKTILAAALPLRLRARDPGSWGDGLRGRFRYVLRPAPALPSPLGWPRVILPDPAVTRGATLRLVSLDPGLALQEELAEVIAIDASGGERTATLSGMAEPSPVQLATLQEVRLEIEVSRPELRERFADLGLSAQHARYALAVLRGDPSGIKTSVGPGSLLIEPVDDVDHIAPPTKLLLSGATELVWREDDLRAHGNDAANDTDRRDFFERPGGASLFDALDVHDDANETQPVSLVGLPDLVHPRQDEALKEPAAQPDAPTLRFGVCATLPVIIGSAPVLDYPRLALSFDLMTASVGALSALDWQARLVALCEADARAGDVGGPTWWGRIAILDLPPGLTASDLLRWRRAVTSRRGCAAIYAPYLRSAPAEAPLAPLVTTPPSGVACGIIARRERSIGVHAAPANEPLRGITALFADGQLPEPGFLHEARINLARDTERGPMLLGSRTTSDDAEWTHISVRRVVHWIERQLAIDTRWAVFEPDTRILRSRLVRGVERRLLGLYAAGALVGAAPAQAFFVRSELAADRGVEGRVTVEVGVAPAVPTEFIVFELTQLVDGGSHLEERHG
jgi:uncharacterized protein